NALLVIGVMNGSIPIPLIIFTGMGIDPFMTPITSKAFLRDTLYRFNTIKNTVYTELANSVPPGEHRILENAGHTTIHTDSTHEVVEAIRNLIDLMNTQEAGTSE